jgi:hypothetical protein
MILQMNENCLKKYYGFQLLSRILMKSLNMLEKPWHFTLEFTFYNIISVAGAGVEPAYEGHEPPD